MTASGGEIGQARLLRANALALPLADSSVDLVVTSPPYFALRSYRDGGEHFDGQLGAEATPEEFLDALVAATREMVRVLRPSGSIWVNLGDKYAGSNGQSSGPSQLSGGGTYSPGGARSKATKKGGFVPRTTVRPKSLLGIPWRYAIRCVDELGLILRAEVIWSKPNGLPESATDRARRSHEQWFHFTKEPQYFSAVDEVREPYDDKTAARYALGFRPGAIGETNNGVLRADNGGPKACNPLGKLPGSVWTIPTEPLKVPAELGVDHFAAFPSEWPRRIILGWSPADAVVLDPFCGTGTTVAVAKALGRIGIGTDLSADYLRLADWRCNGAGFDKISAKVRKKSRRPEPTLFGAVT